MKDLSFPVNGAGLGLRRSFIKEFLALDRESCPVDFLEVAPENWMKLGGRFKKQFEQLAERYPIVLHGLSLDIGGSTPLDTGLVNQVREFTERYHCPVYSDHLTYCAQDGHLYDLMPLPFTEESVMHVAERVRQVQDILGFKLALENASYYAATANDLTELQFINAVVEEADCHLLLDVNNIYVNSINHSYDPVEFLQGLPLHRCSYIHIAGHFEEDEDLRVDTHGAAVIDPVWGLLEKAYQVMGDVPTLLERDFNIPPLPKLFSEVEKISAMQQAARGEFVLNEKTGND